jgi:hypothetical protein
VWFLVHIQQALNIIRQKSLFVVYDKASKDQEECAKTLTKANEALVNYKGEDTDLFKAKVVQKTNESSTHANEAVSPIIDQVFWLYSNLLLEEAQQPWDKVLEKQIDCKP